MDDHIQTFTIWKIKILHPCSIYRSMIQNDTQNPPPSRQKRPPAIYCWNTDFTDHLICLLGLPTHFFPPAHLPPHLPFATCPLISLQTPIPTHLAFSPARIMSAIMAISHPHPARTRWLRQSSPSCTCRTKPHHQSLLYHSYTTSIPPEYFCLSTQSGTIERHELILLSFW